MEKNHMKEIERFHDAVNNLPGLAAEIKAGNKKILGYPCSYAPEELIYAAGFHPMRLFSSKPDIVLAENHFQSYCCSPVRGILEDSLSGRLDFLAGMVFPHTCDSMQRLSDIWRMNRPYELFADVILPAKFNTQSAGTYMHDVLFRFKADLETAADRAITPDDLKKSIQTFNLIRKNLSRIYALRSRHPGLIRGPDLYALVKGSMIMDRDELAGLLPLVSEGLEQKAVLDTACKRIVLSGSICDFPDIHTAIESAGGAVVGDDLCTGQRWFEQEIPENKDPLAAIASRYMNRLICPAKHVSVTARGESIVNLAKKNRADGVIFMLMKFCDPHAFDIPFLTQFLDQQGIKSMVLEMDDQQQAQGRISTRIETFIHMI